MERREQNKTLMEWEQLKLAVDSLDPLLIAVLYRGSYDYGKRVDYKSKGRDPEAGTQLTSYNDPTGETAVRRAVGDRVTMHVEGIAHHISTALNLAKSILDITPADVEERARRSIPDCLACGEPVPGRVTSGYDESCYKAWQRAGYPERPGFERDRRKYVADKKREAKTSGGKTYQVEEIDALQGAKVLPFPSNPVMDKAA